ncbi:hypothetical protein BDN70DRAFT_241507 [Pholiota conissans]|uniref:Uncharacterized protein n=1 Tax=Pholiota conissans TaxID=109636 RepID=A0A9P5ZFR2_9AGAR|nr:hypothetical protein BDN70DRAFT_241507 [Pholiota conissans]
MIYSPIYKDEDHDWFLCQLSEHVILHISTHRAPSRSFVPTTILVSLVYFRNADYLSCRPLTGSVFCACRRCYPALSLSHLLSSESRARTLALVTLSSHSLNFLSSLPQRTCFSAFLTMNHEESLKYCEEQDALMLADERAHPEKYRGRGARSQRRLELILGNPAAKEEFERFVTYVSTPLKPKEEESAPVSRAPNPDSFVLRRCCRCAIYSHDPQAQAHIFIDNAEYKAHMNTQHSAWKELILVMVIPSDDPKVETQYRCPTVVCTFKASTEADVRAHCLEDCHENVRPRYIAMYNQDIILNRRQGLGDEIMRRGMEFFNNFENADTR